MKAPLIGLAISALCFVLSIGLCGMERNSTGGSLVAAGLLLLAAAIIGGIVSVIWLIVALVKKSR